MKFLKEDALTFDDVTLVPNYSEIRSRKQPDVSFSCKGLHLDIPIIAAPMNSVCEYAMAYKLKKMGATGVIHRYMSIEEQLQQLWNFWETDIYEQDLPFFAIGATGDYLERFEELYKNGVRKFCIDVASGDSIACIEAVKNIRKINDVLLMAGNVCTQEGCERLAQEGANMIRVGVGSGAACTTRIVSGHGVPQLTALMNALKAKEKYPDMIIVSDGGHKKSGDLVKSLAIADVVMLGSLLSATKESPGETLKDHETGEEYKIFCGMASEAGRAMNDWFDREKTSFIPEGESMRIKYKGSVKDIIDNLVGGLKVGMSYCGANNLQELKEKAVFQRVTQNGYHEGTPHGKDKK